MDQVSSEAKIILEIFANLMSDDDEYLRKNLGPFAIGDAVLPKFPKPTLTFLKKMSKKTDPITKWNVAMSFSSKASKAYKKEGLQILNSIKIDDNKMLNRAVKKAFKNLDG